MRSCCFHASTVSSHELAEELLQPNEPLFEYWGHEASWIPMELYPVFEFRRKAFRRHPWWGDLIGQHPQIAKTCAGVFGMKAPFVPSTWKAVGAAAGGI